MCRSQAAWCWKRTGQLSPPSLVEDMRSSARSQPKIWHWRAAQELKEAVWWMKDWHGCVTMTTTIKCSLICMSPKWKTVTSDLVSSRCCLTCLNRDLGPRVSWLHFSRLSCSICSGKFRRQSHRSHLKMWWQISLLSLVVKCLNHES